MKVELTLLDGSVLAVPVSRCGGDLMTTVHPRQMLGGVPYRALRKLGDGEHELALEPAEWYVADDPAAPDPADAEPSAAGYIGYAILSFIMAPVLYVVFAFIEQYVGPVCVNWLIAFAYNHCGGKMGVAGLLVVMGCTFLVASVVRQYDGDA